MHTTQKKRQYSNILKEVRYSLSLLESHKNENNDEDVKIYISAKNKKEKNITLKTKCFNRESIYLCLETIVYNGKKNNLTAKEIFENVNQYINLLDSEQLIEKEYYLWIKSAENFSQICNEVSYEIFLILIFENKDTIKFRQEQLENQVNEIYYIKRGK